MNSLSQSTEQQEFQNNKQHAVGLDSQVIQKQVSDLRQDDSDVLINSTNDKQNVSNKNNSFSNAQSFEHKSSFLKGFVIGLLVGIALIFAVDYYIYPLLKDSTDKLNQSLRNQNAKIKQKIEKLIVEPTQIIGYTNQFSQDEEKPRSSIQFDSEQQINEAGWAVPEGLPGDFQVEQPQQSWSYKSHPQKEQPIHQDNERIHTDKYNLDVTIEKLLKDRSLHGFDVEFEDYYTMTEQNFYRLKTKRAIQRLQINHNVNYKGELKVEATQNEPTQEDVKAKQERLKHILQKEKQQFEYYYHLSKYEPYPHRFCVVVPSYNNAESRLYLRNLDSIFMQQYENYHIVYIDDASPDDTYKFVEKYMEDHPEIPEDKIRIIRNEENMLALANIYNGIHNYCSDGEIVMLLDGDDSFIGRQVMSTFNAAYHKYRAGFVYSQYLVVARNQRTATGGSSRKIPQSALQQQKFRQNGGFYTSHLITYYVDAFKMIDKSDFTYDNGTFFKFAYDAAICTPLIEIINPRIHFIQHLMYEYRFDTGMNDPGWGQMDVSRLIHEKKPYKKLENFDFIDDFYKGIEYDPVKEQESQQMEAKKQQGQDIIYREKMEKKQKKRKLKLKSTSHKYV